MEQKDFYDIRELLTYNFDIALITGKRNDGKTFGYKEQFMRNFSVRNERFVAITRTKESIGDVAAGYFDAVMSDTRDEKLRKWIETFNPRFGLSNKRMILYTQRASEKKAHKEVCGYFTPINVRQDAKERTFSNVRLIAMDEAIIEPADLQHRRYGKSEWENLANIVTSCSKGNATMGKKVQVLLCANAVDIINPWFRAMHLYEVPAYGKHWYRVGNARILYDNIDPALYKGGSEKNADDVGAKMIAGTVDAQKSYDNDFSVSQEFIAKRPKGAEYECGFIYHGRVFASWIEHVWGVTYICSKFLTNTYAPMFALTTQDNRVNYLAANESRKAMRNLIERYSIGTLRFESVSIREEFFRMMRDFGIK